MTTTSGSAAYESNPIDGTITHRVTGQSWRITPWLNLIYHSIAAMRGRPVTSARLAQAWTPHGYRTPDTIRMAIQRIRAIVGDPSVIEASVQSGYFVRPYED